MNHLKLAHLYWQNHLKKKAVAVDCTMGNGKDLLFLARHLLPLKGIVYGLDIQKKAFLNSFSLIKKNFTYKERKDIRLFLQSHENFDILENQKVSLFVYNLGYLPFSDKKIQTQAKITLKSLNIAIDILADNGAISIICYPGQSEGKKEMLFIEKRINNLKKDFAIHFHRWCKKKDSPCLFWIKKIR